MIAVVTPIRTARTHTEARGEPSGMTAEFTDKHVDKRVVAANGTEVGTVDHGSMYVAVGPDADRDTLEDLRWTGVVNREVHHLDDHFIANITEDTVRLSV